MSPIPSKPKKESAAHSVEHFFRHESAKVISYLTNYFGTKNFEIVEDAVQEALIKAMQVWSFKKIPDNPSGWITRVAKNKVIDVLRKESKTDHIFEFPEEHLNAIDPVISESTFQDDQLKMIFACCQPSISHESQIVLILKILCGFGKREIAKALLKKEDAIAKTYTRSKQKLQSFETAFDVPTGAELEERLPVVLKVIYLLFNEGYSSSAGELLIKKELCVEAIRLTHLLLDSEKCASPETHALIALMYFHAARFDSRTDSNGDLLTIDEQDRNLWEKELINLASYHLNLAVDQENLSPYFIQASILSCHCMASDYQATNWKYILNLYDILLRIQPSPVAALNRIVAYSKIHGAKMAVKELKQISPNGALANYHLYFAIKAELHTELGQFTEAKVALIKSISLVANQAEKKYLNKKLSQLKNG